MGLAIDASARLSSEYQARPADAGGAAAKECEELTKHLQRPNVITTFLELYDLPSITFLADTTCAEHIRTPALPDIAWEQLEVHRVGTTSLIMKAPHANDPNKHFAIKFVHFLFTNIPAITAATKGSYKVSRKIRAQKKSRLSVPAVLASGEGWVIQEFIDGQTVAEYVACRLADRAPPSVPVRLHLLRDVYIPIVGTLAHLHSEGIVHGDLNPSNIILRGTTPHRHTGGHVVASAEQTPVCFIDLGRNLLASAVIGRVKSPDAHFVAPEVITLPPDEVELQQTADYYSLGLLLALCLGMASPHELLGGQIPDELFAWEPLLAGVMADLADPKAAHRLTAMRRHDCVEDNRAEISRAADHSRATRAAEPTHPPEVAAGEPDLARLVTYLDKLHQTFTVVGDKPSGERGALVLFREIARMILKPGRLVSGLTEEMKTRGLPAAEEYRYLAFWVRIATCALGLSAFVVLLSVWSRYGQVESFDPLHWTADGLRWPLEAIGISLTSAPNARYDESCAAGLSVACAIYLYYVSAFRIADFRRCAPQNWLAHVSEFMMRMLTVLALPFVVLANFFFPELLALFSGMGFLLVAVTSWLVWWRKNQVIADVEAALAARRDNSPGYWEKLESSKRLWEWVPMLGFVASLYLGLAVLLIAGVGRDYTLYALGITLLNVVGFGMTQTKRSVEEIAPSLARTAVLGERMTTLRAREATHGRVDRGAG